MPLWGPKNSKGGVEQTQEAEAAGPTVGSTCQIRSYWLLCSMKTLPGRRSQLLPGPHHGERGRGRGLYMLQNP